MFEQRKKSRFISIFLRTVLIVALFCAAVYLAAYFYFSRNNSIKAPEEQRLGYEASPETKAQAADDAGNAASDSAGHIAANVAKTATPGVVGLSVLKADSGSIFDRNGAEKWGAGSGVIVNSNGYILTNYHVAGGQNKKIIVSLIDGRNLDGTTLWADQVLDLAIVKANVSGLSTIPLGDSTTLQVGEPAIAIGNPYGLQFQRTVTSGIISALNRTIQIDTDYGSNFMEDLIQTDASINPGNSGGPLLNSKGEVVGINTIKVTSAEGMGFAVPVNIVVPIIRQLADNGSFAEPYFGIFAYDREVLPYLDSNLTLANGVYVAKIDEFSPAFRGGLRVGSIITQIDGTNINTMLQLRTYLYTRKPGDTINVSYLSGGTPQSSQIKLAQKGSGSAVTR